MQDVLSIILGGGRGTRLFPLTMLRSKPAVPLAGKYRLIDIPISNCLNSGCNRIFVASRMRKQKRVTQEVSAKNVGRDFELARGLTRSNN